MITVFDVGKTTAKCVVFDVSGHSVWETRSAQNWIDRDGMRVLDESDLLQWIIRSAETAASETGSERIVITTHGLTVGYAGENSTSPLPVLDYEHAIPHELAALFLDDAPPFDETFSPVLPLGFNFGAQIDCLSRMRPEDFAKVRHILGYPQYLCWRLTGHAVSERTYLGHLSHCWAPLKHGYSSLVAKKNWTHLFPPLLEAGEALGYAAKAGSRVLARSKIFNGIHDSSAALHFYRHLGHEGFTLVSTGTWVIMFDTACPLTSLDPRRDMLASVTTTGEPIATLRFMGGRDYDLLSRNSRLQITERDILTVVEKGIFAMPGLSKGGQFPDSTAEILGGSVENEREGTALASLYLACMTRNGLDAINTQSTIIVDGGLCRNKAFLGVLAGLAPGKTLLSNPEAEGTALGAACTVKDSNWTFEPEDPCQRVRPWNIPGLEDYFLQWRHRAEVSNGAR